MKLVVVCVALLFVAASSVADKSPEKRGAADVEYANPTSTASPAYSKTAQAYVTPKSAGYAVEQQQLQPLNYATSQKLNFVQPQQARFQYSQPIYQGLVAAVPQQFNYAAYEQQQQQLLPQQIFHQAAEASQQPLRLYTPSKAAAGPPQSVLSKVGYTQVPTFSPASSVSSFSYSSPLVHYTNLGLISQSVGKTAPKLSYSQPLTSSPSPVSHHASSQSQVSGQASVSAHQPQQQQQQQQHLVAAPQARYLAIPQGASQANYVQPQGQQQQQQQQQYQAIYLAPQGSHSAPAAYAVAPQQVYMTANQAILAAQQYLQGSHSSPQAVYVIPQYAQALLSKNPGVVYA